MFIDHPKLINFSGIVSQSYLVNLFDQLGPEPAFSGLGLGGSAGGYSSHGSKTVTNGVPMGALSGPEP